MKNCFVVCPIGNEGSDVRKRSDQVLKFIIAPVCEELGYTPVRSDKIHDADKIDQTIIDHLTTADLIIADLSDQNPNAFFETGYRTALDKPLIQIMAHGQQLPFDVSGVRTIFYDLTDPDKIEDCKKRLSETIKAICLPPEDDASDRILPPASADFQQLVNAKILTQLLEIKDLILELKDIADANNAKVLEQLITAFANQMHAASTPQDKAMEIFFKEFCKNPQKMSASLQQLSKLKFPNQR